MLPIDLVIKYNNGPLIKAPGRVERITNHFVEQTAESIKDNVRMNIYDRGLIKSHDLFNSVDILPFSDGFIVFVGAEYGQFHEYGTTSMPARPFFFPAVDEVVSHIYYHAQRAYAELALS